MPTGALEVSHSGEYFTRWTLRGVRELPRPDDTGMGDREWTARQGLRGTPRGGYVGEYFTG